MNNIVRVFYGIVVFLMCCYGTSEASDKYALVIGNSDYEEAPLRNPVYDASDMTYTLMKLGFTTFSYFNTTHENMEEAVREFTSSLRPGDVALFYFSGHGVQVGGNNYLLPIKTHILNDNTSDSFGTKYLKRVPQWGRRVCFAKNIILHPEQRGGLNESARHDTWKNVNHFNATTKIYHDPVDDGPTVAGTHDLSKSQSL